MGPVENTSEENYTQPDQQKPWIGTDAVFRYLGDKSSQYKQNQITGPDLQRMIEAIQRLGTPPGQLPDDTQIGF